MNRREFTALTLGAPAIAFLQGCTGSGTNSVPASEIKPNATATRVLNPSVINGVQFGIQPFCYHDMVMSPGNRPELIRKIIANGFSMVELHATWCEPGLDELGGSREKARMKLREWRLSTADDHYAAIRKEFDEAGISIFTYYVDMDGHVENAFIAHSDEEVDATFKAAKILGAGGCVGSQGLKSSKRLAPFAEKHGMFMSLHNHANLSDPDQISSEETFIKGFSFSPNIMATFDTRHYAAANGDCLAFIEKHHERIRNIHLGDRKKNQGRSAPFGQGDVPIVEVLRMIRDNSWPIVVMLEFEHGTLHKSVKEVQLMFDYCKRALV